MSRRKKSRKKRASARHARGKVHHTGAVVPAASTAADVVTTAEPAHSEPPAAEPDEAPAAARAELPDDAPHTSDAPGFSELEASFFAAGDALADAPAPPVDDFSDLEPRPEPADTWARRALDVLGLIPARQRR